MYLWQAYGFTPTYMHACLRLGYVPLAGVRIYPFLHAHIMGRARQCTQDLDKNKDGRICQDEIFALLQEKLPEAEVRLVSYTRTCTHTHTHTHTHSLTHTHTHTHTRTYMHQQK